MLIHFLRAICNSIRVCVCVPVTCHGIGHKLSKSITGNWIGQWNGKERQQKKTS